MTLRLGRRQQVHPDLAQGKRHEAERIDTRWQAVAAGGMSIGLKGMVVAAKSMALTAIDLYSDPAHIALAREEFDKRRGPNFTYSTRLANRKPALDYRK